MYCIYLFFCILNEIYISVHLEKLKTSNKCVFFISLRYYWYLFKKKHNKEQLLPGKCIGVNAHNQ